LTRTDVGTVREHHHGDMQQSLSDDWLSTHTVYI